MKTELTYAKGATLKAHKLGEPVTIEQHLPLPFDLFSLKKYLERFDLNEYNVDVYEFHNPHMYSLGFHMPDFNVSSVEDFYKAIGGKLGCEPDQQTISEKIQSILNVHKTTKSKY
ncbi:protein of unknown function [Pseudotevenvirus RB43]|uniref:Uncharacterized protein n=1 Tax=Pseudotevenvirus RB43 TaxID=115991 RepID=K0NXT8_9CAUD|nr:protein of unknown function [Pseudotevenvirus RB43]CCL97585.1 protein of unknown function [Pseudotevenvirus RB43]